MRLFWNLLLLMPLIVSCKLYTEDELVVDLTKGKEFSYGDLYKDENGNTGIVIKIQKETSKGVASVTRIVIMSTDQTQCEWGRCDSLFNHREEQHLSTWRYRDALFSCQMAVEIGLDHYPAIKWCYQKNHKSKQDVPEMGDWVLPGRYELETLNYEWINSTLRTHGFPTTEGLLWSADSFSSTEAYACSQSNITPVLKSTVLHVRAIKYIYFKE